VLKIYSFIVYALVEDIFRGIFLLMVVFSMKSIMATENRLIKSSAYF